MFPAGVGVPVLGFWSWGVGVIGVPVLGSSYV